MVAPEAELCLLLAGTRARRSGARDRIVQLARDLEAPRLIADLGERRLLALLGSRLLELGPEAHVEGLADGVAAALERGRRAGLALEAVTRRLALALERGSVPALPLKGALLSLELYGDVGMRPGGDIDLLVGARALERAIGIVRAHGYGPPEAPHGPADESELHVVLRHAQLPPVELHRRVPFYEDSFSADMLAAAAPGPDGVRRARPIDEGAGLLLFFARDGFHGVRYAADIGAWWDLHVPPAAAGILDAHVERYPALARSLRAAALAAERYAGVPAGGLVSSTAGIDARGRRAVRLGTWSAAGSRDQLAANVSLVDALLGPAGNARGFVRRELLPPPVSILPPGSPLPTGLAALRCRLTHAAKMLARYTFALWRVRGGREWAPSPPVGD